MIIFETLRYRNFLSAGDLWVDVNLNKSNRTLIVGANGSGKSQLCDALSFALFGRAHRRINKPQLVNTINGKNTEVELTFRAGSSLYKIRRGLKPNIFEIWVNGEMIDQESHSRDYQSLLETNILKLNHKSFHQLVVLGSSNFTPFMQLNAQHRRAVIEDLLDIGIFSKMNNILKESAARIRDSLKDADYNLNLLKEKIALQNTHTHRLREMSKASSAKYDDEIQTLQEQVSSLLAENKTLLSKTTTQFPELQKSMARAESKRRKLEVYSDRIKEQLRAATSEKTFYENHTVCPTCQQDISNTLKTEKIHACQNNADRYASGQTLLDKEHADIVAEISEVSNKLRDLQATQSKLNTNASLVQEYESRVRSLQNLKTQGAEFVDIGSAEAETEKMRTERDSVMNERASILEERGFVDVCAELLKDSGIKTRVIRQYLPLMNSFINRYLQILDFFVSFELDENFNEIIRSRHRDDFSYDSFSEGEKSRIDLSIMFAWRQIARIKNSTNTNLLILDEVFDSSLDADGVDNLLKIMNSLDDDTRLYVITHKPEGFEPFFDRKITAKRHGNFSKYHFESLMRSETM